MTREKIKQASPESQDERERLLNEYGQQMGTYQRITKKVRALERRYPPGARDRATNFEITELDKERHQNHLRLIEIAEKLGKSKEDVFVDIIRWENSLEEYGLPEFSILKDSDIVDTETFHSAIQFNIEPRAGKPASPAPLDKAFGDYEFGKETYDGIARRVLKEDQILLVFSINPVEDYGDEEIKPDDFKEREKRAEALAGEIGGEYFDNYQGGYHGTSAHIIGVVFPKKDLEKVAGIVRNNPNKFRLGKEFYTNGE